ncbi:hypothetical protein PMAL9190_01157 [Photobacterium malacitanum]|uniref:Core-binding (CB) domain-containing protein n=1 Tax=Photobacterium malacitanum TaxID=2204294 RepID=A0A1Y6MD43_9GAMM|nr:hypothetical protein PMAL9190_01157 [Photobacterium malacitanum]
MMNNEQQQRSYYLYEQYVTHLTLQGKRPATIDGYSRALRRITHHLDKSPDTLTTDDLKRYFAQLIKTHSWNTVRIDRNRLRKLWVFYVFSSDRCRLHDKYPYLLCIISRTASAKP